MDNNINLIMMGGFTYPSGMAGTKRVQNVIDSLKEYANVTCRVILQRQSSQHNLISGVYKNTPYDTIMGDLLGSKMFVALPVLCSKTIAALKNAYRPEKRNVIYFYGPLFIESVVPLSCAQRIGYKIVFDIIEDYSLEKEVTNSLLGYMKSHLTNWLSSGIESLATGIVVISTHLESKYKTLTLGKVPIHYMPISVDMERFPAKNSVKKPTVSLFYAGSFSKKDGIPVLLDAFDQLSEKYSNIILVLTGRGDNESMKHFFSRMCVSPHKNRIEFKGYLDEDDYFDLLGEVDIPCMTRVDIAFAHAGFPFKLGEFIATGKPVIVSHVSDVDRFLVHRHNAMLIRPGSSLDICEAVEFLLNNPESAAAIGLRGREVAKSFFDFRQQGRALLTFLEKL